MSTLDRSTETTPQAAAVLLEPVDGVAWVTLNRPKVLNAMDAQLMDDLREALHRVAQDPAIRCVMLRGSGRAFCAGGDMKMMAERRDGTSSIAARMDQQHQDLLRRSESSLLLASMPKPTVAVLHGHVVGGGLSLALACDLRLAAESTRLRVGFSANALSGDFGIAHLLQSMVGSGRARAMMLLDRVVDAETALADGLVSQLSSDHELPQAAHALAAQLAAAPTLALGRMKRNLLRAETLSLQSAIEYEAMNQRVTAFSEDAAEAGSAFAEQRSPRFRGR